MRRRGTAGWAQLRADPDLRTDVCEAYIEEIAGRAGEGGICIGLAAGPVRIGWKAPILGLQPNTGKARVGVSASLLAAPERAARANRQYP